MSSGKILQSKLLMEGKEVPFIGATVTHTVGQASIAYIDLVPQKEINNIKPRTLVSLYVRDFNAPQTTGNLNFPYILMWEGEVFGYSMSKTPNSRQFTIQAVDYTSYWDNVVTYFMNAQQSLSKGANAIAEVGKDIVNVEAAGGTVLQTAHSTASLYIQTIDEVLKDDSKDFLDAFVAIYKKVAGINQFYNLAESRLRIVDRILLNSSGKLAELIKNAEARRWIEGIAGSHSGFATLRTVLQDLISLVFHDYVTVPFPAKVESDAKGVEDDPIQFVSDQVKRTVGSFIFKPNLYMLPPPMCNVFYPDEYSSFTFNRNFFAEPTRLIYKPEILRVQGATLPTLPHRFQPDSLQFYMLRKEAGKTFESEGFLDETGRDPLKVDEEIGNFGDPDTSETKENNQGSKREQQFLTNEEKMRGVLMAQERLLPAATSFRGSIEDEGKARISDGIAEYLFFKKRFEPRTLQITSHLKFSVVPGFPVLILDDSDADQSMTAYCSSVTHRIYATQGGYTNTTLSYARTVEEQDTTSDGGSTFLIPPWFDEEIFGTKTTTREEADKIAEAINKGLSDQIITSDTLVGRRSFTNPEGLSAFYAGLLGEKGSSSILDATNNATSEGAAKALLKQYRSARSRNHPDIQQFISFLTSRDYITMRQAMKFLGAGTVRKDLTTPFVEFLGDRLKGKGSPDETQISLRRAVIDKYRSALRSKRGFRG